MDACLHGLTQSSSQTANAATHSGTRDAECASSRAQALSLPSIAPSFSGSSVRRIRSTSVAVAATSDLQHALLDAEQVRRVHREVRASPRPSSSRVSSHVAGHFAAHGDRHLRLRRAADRERRSAAAPPDAADRRDARRRRPTRSTASVYWMRSLVPIDRKSSLRRNAPIASTAAGISIMPPTLTSAIERHALLAQAFLRLRDHRQRLVDLRRPTRASAPGSARCRSATRAGSRAAA